VESAFAGPITVHPDPSDLTTMYDEFENMRSNQPIDDYEYPDPPDDDDDDQVETVPCPECGAQVYEEAERCPYCGGYITSSTHPLKGRPLWWVVLGVLGVVGLVIAICCF